MFLFVSTSFVFLFSSTNCFSCSKTCFIFRGNFLPLHHLGQSSSCRQLLYTQRGITQAASVVGEVILSIMLYLPQREEGSLPAYLQRNKCALLLVINLCFIDLAILLVLYVFLPWRDVSRLLIWRVTAGKKNNHLKI